MTLMALFLVAASVATQTGAVAAPAGTPPGAPAVPATLPTQPASGPSADVTAAVKKALKKLKYDAHLRAARAFWAIGEDAKAIEAYRQALITAPDAAARGVVRGELERIAHVQADVERSFYKRFRSVINWPYWTPVAAVLAVFVLIWLLGTVWWCVGLCRGKRWLTIRSGDAGLPGNYLRQAIVAVRLDFEEQQNLAARIVEHSNASAAPTPRGISLSTRLSVQSFHATSYAQGWTSMIWKFWNVFYWARAAYKVDVQLLRAEKQIGVGVLLRSRGAVRKYWRRTSVAEQLPDAVADIAYDLVVFVLEMHEGNR